MQINDIAKVAIAFKKSYPEEVAKMHYPYVKTVSGHIYRPELGQDRVIFRRYYVDEILEGVNIKFTNVSIDYFGIPSVIDYPGIDKLETARIKHFAKKEFLGDRKLMVAYGDYIWGKYGAVFPIHHYVCKQPIEFPMQYEKSMLNEFGAIDDIKSGEIDFS